MFGDLPLYCLFSFAGFRGDVYVKLPNGFAERAGQPENWMDFCYLDFTAKVERVELGF